MVTRTQTGHRGLACDRFVMPSTKQMESRMLDLPLPLRPVMALKKGSKFGTLTRVAYDLKPSSVISSIYILAFCRYRVQLRGGNLIACSEVTFKVQIQALRALHLSNSQRKLPRAAHYKEYNKMSGPASCCMVLSGTHRPPYVQHTSG